MAKVMRWVGLAVFCAVFGFVGSVGGIKLMADELRGEQGPAGLPGIIGPPGEQGPVGATGPAGDISSLESRVALVRTSLNKLTPRVNALETKVDTPPPAAGCEAGTPVEVVTSATLTKAGRNLSLSTSKASITPCQ
jgi:hypothetical protein